MYSYNTFHNDFIKLFAKLNGYSGHKKLRLIFGRKGIDRKFVIWERIFPIAVELGNRKMNKGTLLKRNKRYGNLFSFLYRSFAIFLVVMLVFNACGYLISYWVIDQYYYQAHLSRSKEESKEKLQQLRFSKVYLQNTPEEFEWVEAKEFRYKGRMYDIFERTETADSVIFLVERDVEEEKLQLAYNSYRTQKKERDVPGNTPSASFLKLIIKTADQPSILQITPDNHYIILESLFLMTYESISLSIDTLPPNH